MATITRNFSATKAGAFLLGVAWVVAGLGCSRQELPKGHVTGRVSFQGKPLEGWIIYFVPERGPTASGLIGKDGQYTLSTSATGDGAVVGRHKVYFSPPSNPDVPTDLTQPESPKPPSRSSQTVLLPSKLLSPATTDKTAEVKPGSQQIDFAL